MTHDPTSPTERLADEALHAFWSVVVAAYPDATTGDLSPETTVALRRLARQAVAEWMRFNVLPPEQHGDAA